ncbi:hypothetical protein V6N13_024828 [Hibiscus sabdariffa]
MVSFIVRFLFECCMIVNNILQLEIAINRGRGKTNGFTSSKNRMLLWASNFGIKFLNKSGIDLPGMLCKLFPLVLSENIHDIRSKVIVGITGENKSFLEEDSPILHLLEALLHGFVDERLWRGRNRAGGSVAHHFCLPESSATQKLEAFGYGVRLREEEGREVEKESEGKKEKVEKMESGGDYKACIGGVKNVK